MAAIANEQMASSQRDSVAQNRADLGFRSRKSAAELLAPTLALLAAPEGLQSARERPGADWSLECAIIRAASPMPWNSL